MSNDSTNRHVPALVYKGEVIHERQEMLSLTDMWKAAHAEKSRQPSEWLASADGTRFLDALAVILKPGNSGFEMVKTVRGGRQPGTWAHWQVALAYAKYLDPDFHIWCNEVVRERMEGRSAKAVPDTLAELIERTDGICRMMIGKVTGIEKSLPELAARIAAEIIPGMLKDQLEADDRAVAIGYKPALRVLEEKKVPARRRRAFSQKVSARLRRFSVTNGYPFRISRETGRYLFHVDAIAVWLMEEGESLIRDHIASLDGQGILRLIPSPKQGGEA